MSNIQSYNALIDRFHAFASGHFILKRFSHGQIEVSDLEKFGEYPFMHVVPSNVTYAKGMKTFSFQIVLADLPRDKEDKPEYQREVLSDLQRIAEDLVAEITNHRMLFGDLITVQNVSLEPFLEEFQHTLTGWTISLDLLVPYYWDACSIPAEWNDFFESGSGGTGSILTFIDSIVRDNNGNVSLVNDEETPAPNYYYGTNDEGVRGWYLTTDNIGLTCETIGDCQTIIDIEAAIDALEEEILLKADITSISAVGFSNDYNDLDNLPTIPTLTSDLTNDGADGVNPFITAQDLPSLTGYVPYTGATQDVDLGEFELKAGQIEFDQTPTGAAGVAVMRWNDSDGTLDLGLKGGNVTLQIGQESVLRVVNKTATNINLLEANYQAVRVTGAQGQRLKVDLALATSDPLSAETIGLVTETINNNQEGFITTSGLVRGINTTGSLQGETWADGDILYLSPTTAGRATKVKPTAPNHLIVLGYVIHAHINQGSIFVKVDNGYELDELHNVKITTPANNNVLAYTSATDIWENKTVATALGFTPENTANKQNSLAVDGTGVKFPTVDAVNTQSMIDKGRKMLSYFFDFIGPVATLDGLQTSVSGGSVNQIAGGSIPQKTVNQQGVVFYTTSVLAVNYAYHINNVNIQLSFGGGVWNFETSINISVLSNATERYRTIHGFGSIGGNVNAVEADGVFLTYDEGATLNGTAASPNWQCVTVANSVRTLTTTSTAVTAGAWHKLRIEVNATGTSAAFYLNGTLLATHTTNIPTFANTRYFIVKQGIAKTAGITARTMFCDYIGYENILTTSR
jgi:hypothetical protein